MAQFSMEIRHPVGSVLAEKQHRHGRNERVMALTRKNALFAGKDVGAANWAMLASLVATCKLNGVNPFNCIHQTLRAILEVYSKNQIAQMMPWTCDQVSGLAA